MGLRLIRQSFNLILEILIIESLGTFDERHVLGRFQSHSWDSYHWEATAPLLLGLMAKAFQSHSWDSYHWECSQVVALGHWLRSFQSHSWDSYHWEFLPPQSITIIIISVSISFLRFLSLRGRCQEFPNAALVIDVSISFLRFLSLRVLSSGGIRTLIALVSISFLRFLSLRVPATTKYYDNHNLRFNLILEILIIERTGFGTYLSNGLTFQSHSWDSYHWELESLFVPESFKVSFRFNLILEILIIERRWSLGLMRKTMRFNLILEILIIERYVIPAVAPNGVDVSISFLRFLSLRAEQSPRLSPAMHGGCFNLILEILIIERHHRIALTHTLNLMFQSHSWDSYHWETFIGRWVTLILMKFQSHSWDSYHWECFTSFHKRLW